MNMRLAVVILFTTVDLGCGDGIVIISVNTGTIVSAPFLAPVRDGSTCRIRVAW